MADQPQDFAAFGEFVDASGTVINEVHCRRCGYDLRGLQLNGLCPECGTPVGRSISVDLLRYADPEWVDKLARGSKLIMGGMTAMVVLMILGACGGFATAVATRGAGMLPFGFIVAGLLFLGAYAFIYYGAWLHTTPDPGAVEEANQITPRRLVRFAIISAIVSSVLGWIGPLVSGTTVEVLLAVLQLGFSIVFAVGFLAYVRYMERVGERTSDERLPKSARTIYRAAIVALVLMLLTQVFGVIVLATGLSSAGAFPVPTTSPTTSPTTMPTTMPAALPSGGFMVGVGGAAVLGCSFSVVVLVVFILFVRWQSRMKKAFIEAASNARETWYAGTPAPTWSPD